MANNKSLEEVIKKTCPQMAWRNGQKDLAQTLRKEGYIHKSEIRIPDKERYSLRHDSKRHITESMGFNSAIDKIKEINKL